MSYDEAYPHLKTFLQYPWHVVVVGEISVEEDPMEDEDHFSGSDDVAEDEHGDHVSGGDHGDHVGEDEHGGHYEPVGSVADV